MRFLTRSLIGLALLSLTLGLLGYAGLNLQGAMTERAARDAAPRTQRERVYAAPVELITPATIAPDLIAYGEVLSTREIELRAPSAGWITETHPAFTEGRTIAAGEVILRIDPADAETERATAQADLEDARNEIADAERALGLAQDELAAAEAQATLRRQALARQQGLLERGFGSETAVETAALAEAASTQTVFSRRKAVVDQETRVEAAQTGLLRRQIALDEAERRVNETILRAPFAGAFSDVTAEVGTRVTQNESLATFLDPTALEARFRISSAQFIRLLDENGQLQSTEARIDLDVQGAAIRTTGRLTGTAAQVRDGQTGRELFATLDQHVGFQPGDFVTVTVTEPALQMVARLPSAALTPDEMVMVLGEDDRLEPVQVRLLRRQGDMVLVDARAIDGREVVTQLTPVLGAGIKVRPVRPAQEAAAAARRAQSAEMVALNPDQRAKLVALVEADDALPAPAKDRLLVRLKQDQVPAELVNRIENRIGG